MTQLAMVTLGEYAAAAGVVLGPLLAVGKWITGKLEANRQQLQAHLADQDHRLQDFRENGSAATSQRLDWIDRHLERQDLASMRLSNRVARIEGRIGLQAAPEISVTGDPID